MLKDHCGSAVLVSWENPSRQRSPSERGDTITSSTKIGQCFEAHKQSVKQPTQRPQRTGDGSLTLTNSLQQTHKVLSYWQAEKVGHRLELHDSEITASKRK
jgi:hypothetical protein